MASHPTKFQISGLTNLLDIAKRKLKRKCPSVDKFLLCPVSTKYYLIENSLVFYSLLAYIVSDYNSRPKRH